MSNKNKNVQSEFSSNFKTTKEVAKATALNVALGPIAGAAVYHVTKKKKK